MGTNYYVHLNTCECCNRSEYVLHLGKNSYGWTFSFRGYNGLVDIDQQNNTVPFTIRSYKDWVELLDKPKTKIFTEYSEEVSIVDFKQLVEDNRAEANNHANYVHRGQLPHYTSPDYIKRNWLDEEGNSFSGGEFC